MPRGNEDDIWEEMAVQAQRINHLEILVTRKFDELRTDLTRMFDALTTDVVAVSLGLARLSARQERRDEAAIKTVERLFEESDIGLVVKYLTEFFSETELKSLIFSLGNVKYEDLPNGTLKRKAEELVGFMRRHGRLRELIETCRTERPHVPWPHLVDEIDEEDMDG